MSAVPGEMWQRRCSLLLTDGSDEALELADLHVQFEVKQEDIGSPDNARIRVENLSRDMESRVQKEYQRVVLQAGYWGSPYGVIFTGTIKQFRKGRADAKTTYLEILAADGDTAYNYAVLNETLAAGSTPKQRADAIVKKMAEKDTKPGTVNMPNTGGILPRGKVLFGLGRVLLRQTTNDRGASWNMLRGKLNITPLDGYLPGEAVVLSAATGLIGRAEQTEQGVVARCLINPQIRVGGLIKIDNKSINATEAAPGEAISAGQMPFDRYGPPQMLADVAADGLYRVYVAEFSGDTRGQEWYCDLIALAVNPVSSKVA